MKVEYLFKIALVTLLFACTNTSSKHHQNKYIESDELHNEKHKDEHENVQPRTH